MQTRHLTLALLFSIILVGAGCSSMNSRSVQYNKASTDAKAPSITTTIPPEWSVTASQEKIDALILAHPTWGLQVYIDVAQGNVRPSMTMDQVRAAWGKPDSTGILNERGDQTWSYKHRDVLFLGDNVREVTQ